MQKHVSLKKLTIEDKLFNSFRNIISIKNT